MIRLAEEKDLPVLAELAALAWSGGPEDYLADMEELLESDRDLVAVSVEGEQVTGFVNARLRYEYVSGTHSSPVVYLEGLSVFAPWRRRGIARALAEYAQVWGRSRGCSQMGSDCRLDNEASYHLHLALGFAEVERQITFVKQL